MPQLISLFYPNTSFIELLLHWPLSGAKCGRERVHQGENTRGIWEYRVWACTYMVPVVKILGGRDWISLFFSSMHVTVGSVAATLRA